MANRPFSLQRPPDFVALLKKRDHARQFALSQPAIRLNHLIVKDSALAMQINRLAGWTQAGEVLFFEMRGFDRRPG